METDQFEEAIEQAKKLPPVRKENIVKKILEEIEASQWDEKWDEKLASPESHLYQEQVYAKLQNDIATGNVKNYLTVDDLEKCF